MDYIVGTTERANYIEIGEEIRAKLGTDTKYPPDQLSTQIGAVYDKGITEGITEGIAQGIEQGIEQGKQTAYNEFWDNYQEEGNRKDYQCAFGGRGWTIDTFKPKYDIIPSRCDFLFSNCTQLQVDLVDLLNTLGVSLDLSNSNNFGNAFAYCYITRVGVIDSSGASSLYRAFHYSRIVTVDKLIIKDDGSTVFTDTFSGQTYLENISFDGVIGQTLNMGSCQKLTKASIESAMTHLSTTATSKTATFSKTAVDNAFATSSGANDGSTSAEWQALKDAVPNWTISLI